LAKINATDFMGGSLERWLIYNPAKTADTATLTLPSGTFRGWDSVRQAIVFDNRSQTATVSLGTDSAAVVTVISTSDTLAVVHGRLMDTTTSEVVDYGTPATQP
jgi:hypothetical protein